MTTSRRTFLISSVALSLSMAATPLAIALPLKLTLEGAIVQIGPDRLAGLVGSMMSWQDDGSGAMWAVRARSVMTSGMRVAFSRGKTGIAELREAIKLKAYVDAVDAVDLNPALVKHARSVLSSIPGYDPANGYQQGQVARDQFGYLEMHGRKTLDLLEAGGDSIAESVLDGTVDWEAINRSIVRG